ncbi:3-deoxy-D-manno-octulosonate cytidylyltransferase [candidate division KSB1 bacterium 4572_119]|nr:MAG: 3-deoxy-D-manno-octulosonate cytidylyltransferase [candidate division KSB1 bacterium 4572_119]
MDAVGIIPARYQSARFPGKPLADILGKTMIQRVYEQALKAVRLSRVIVATDDERIYKEVKRFGGLVEMTSKDAANGTERLAEVAANLDCSLVVNIQGDEPLINPDVIDQLVDLMMENPGAPVGTLVKKITSVDVLKNPNIPKVVLDKNKNALYFSRSLIPFDRNETDLAVSLKNDNYYQHIGIYIYQKDFLLKFIQLPESQLEQIEKLEQLRILENGFKIKTALTDRESIGVDVPEDLEQGEYF